MNPVKPGVDFHVVDECPIPSSGVVQTKVDSSHPRAIVIRAVPEGSPRPAAGSSTTAPSHVVPLPPPKGGKVGIYKIGGGVAIPIAAKNDKEEAELQECFEKIKEKTFDILFKILKDKLGTDPQIANFKLFVTKDRVGTWEYQDGGHGQNGKIDYCPECEKYPDLKGQFDVFDNLLLESEQVPLDMCSFPVFIGGGMSDITQPNGFHILPRETRSKLPGNTGGFITDHLGRVMSGKSKEEHYDAMEKIMLRDRRKKRLESIVKEQITELETRDTTTFSPKELRAHQDDLRVLSDFSDRLRESDEFAANFALCHLGETLDAVADAAEVHLRATPGVLAPNDYSTYFMGGKNDLHADDKEYCKLVGTLVGKDRLEYHDYCNKHEIRCGNTVMEADIDNFLPVLKSLKVSDRVYDDITAKLGTGDSDEIEQGMKAIPDRNSGGDVTNVFLEIINGCKKVHNWETFVPAPEVRSRGSSTGSSLV